MRTRRRTHFLNPILTLHLDALSADRAFARDYRTRVAALIDTQLAAGNRSQAQVAEKLGLSVSTLARSLRAEGVRFRDLLAARRLDTAERLLTEAESRVASVALATGYAEAASCSRALRRRTQLSPTQYRRATRRQE